MIALTSLAPDAKWLDRQTACIASWRAAGLSVRSLNTEAEIETLRSQYDTEFVATVPTDAFTKPYITLNRCLDEVARIGEPTLLINADLELAVTPTQLQRFAAAAHDGLGYLLYFNHDADRANQAREDWGMSAFLVQPRHAALLAPSWLCLGQPWWDYALPWAAHLRGELLYTPVQPMGYHLRHDARWDAANWRRCAVEFARVTGMVVDEEDEAFAYQDIASKVMRSILELAVKVDVGA
jgi:hypothetical protein